MGDAETEKKRSSLGKKIKLAVLILVILFAALYVPAKFLAVKHTNRGTQLYNESKFDEAITQYELAMKIFPGFKAARERLGMAYREGAENAFAGNNYEEAKKLYKKALKLRADVPDVHYKLATICLGQGNHAEGLAELDKHLKENPNDGRTLGLRRILQRGMERQATGERAKPSPEDDVERQKKTEPPRSDKETKPAAERKQPPEEVKAPARVRVAAAEELVGKPAPELALRDLHGKEAKRSSPAAKVGALAFDGFDGKLSLDWEILKPDPSHYSLSKKQGMLTITTQEGGFARASTNYKNLFLVDCPAGAGEDFQITTRISSFKPAASWNQAGLIFYNDEDNYLKWDYETTTGSPAVFTVGRETEGSFVTSYFQAPPGLEDVWLKVMKRGNRYAVGSSSDGKLFFPHGEFTWGDGAVGRVGLFAKNGPDSEAPELDAFFDFFEVSSVPEQMEQEGLGAAEEGIVGKIVARGGQGKLLASDGFEGELSLDWEILNSDPSHYSLSKNPGVLTITTQEGAFVLSNKNYKNLFLIDRPPDGGGDFEITTCIASFKPVADWNQAGLICYNDDDNYLKFIFVRSGGERVFAVGLETEGSFAGVPFPVEDKPKKLWVRLLTNPLGLDRQLGQVWLRIAKRGSRYTFATSLDGKTFVQRICPLWDESGRTQDEFIWGDGFVKRVGLFAKNGPGSQAPEIDALFDSFEVRAVMPAEAE